MFTTQIWPEYDYDPNVTWIRLWSKYNPNTIMIQIRPEYDYDPNMTWIRLWSKYDLNMITIQIRPDTSQSARTRWSSRNCLSLYSPDNSHWRNRRKTNANFSLIGVSVSPLFCQAGGSDDEDTVKVQYGQNLSFRHLLNERGPVNSLLNKELGLASAN